MAKLLNARGVRTQAISIDDFYLTGEEQDALAATHSDNPLLQSRGNAGTHSVPLALRTISALQAAGDADSVLIPRYDKSKRNGKGDRADPGDWSVHIGKTDIILLEGWMLGFQPLPESSPLIQGAAQGLAEVNRLLQRYSPLHAAVDAWIVVKVADAEWVQQWRQGAEATMIRRGKTGMSPEQVAQFVQGFMPAYKAYLPGLYSTGPEGIVDSVTGKRKPLLQIELDQSRRPVYDTAALPEAGQQQQQQQQRELHSVKSDMPS
jgi:D-glycerate 3-kinase